MRNNKGQFVKGSSGFKGKHSEETRAKIRKARARQGSNVWNKGTNLSGMKGKQHSLESRIKIGLPQENALNHNWKGGITPLRSKIWHSFIFRQWRSDCFQRDNYVCQECEKIGGVLNIHHIKAFSDIMREYNIKTLEQAIDCAELWNINNGRTLCIDCHKKTENYGGKQKRK